MNFLKKLFTGDRALASYKKGIRFYNNKDFVKAIEQFEIVLSKRSNKDDMEHNLSKFYCSQAYRNIGIVFFAKGKNEKALHNFQQALSYNPNHTDLNYFIGICLNNIGKFEEAVESFNNLQKIDPSNIPNKLKLAVIFHNLGMWDNAEKINRSILLKKPNYADVHFHLGLSLLSQGKSEQAIRSFKRALKINPNYIDARLKLSIAQANVGLFDASFENLDRILALHPDYADVNYLYGALKGEVKEYKTAIRFLKTAVKQNPKYKTAHIKLVLFYCIQGQLGLAEEQIVKVCNHFPDDMQLDKVKKIIENLLSEKTDDFSAKIPREVEKIFGEEQLLEELANEFYTHLDIMPNFSEIIALFTNSKYVQEDDSISEIIIPLVQEQIEKHPDYPDLYNSLGSQLLTIQNMEEAKAAFEKAVELNPQYVAARIDLMKTLHKMEEYENAYEQGKLLLALNLPYPDVYYTISEILYFMGSYDDAISNCEKVLELSPEFEKASELLMKIKKDIK